MINFIYFILFIVIIIIISYLIHNNLLDKKFYNYKKIYPELNIINKNNNKIIHEINHNLFNENKLWLDWKEKHLYNDNEINGKWKIIPLYGFNTWCIDNCKKFPTLYNTLKKISKLKLAIISKLGPKMKLLPHYGWGSHSNNVLRCHYGIKLNENTSYISVRNNYNDKEEIQYHKLHDWIVFDDSKLHYAENKNNEDRIVLIVDLVRPIYIKKGTSNVIKTDELLELVNEFKNINSNNLDKI